MRRLSRRMPHGRHYRDRRRLAFFARGAATRCTAPVAQALRPVAWRPSRGAAARCTASAAHSVSIASRALDRVRPKTGFRRSFAAPPARRPPARRPPRGGALAQRPPFPGASGFLINGALRPQMQKGARIALSFGGEKHLNSACRSSLSSSTHMRLKSRTISNRVHRTGLHQNQTPVQRLMKVKLHNINAPLQET